MAKKKREVPEVNSSSTADIAFLLLIFFLVTTSMDTDRGLARRLPPPPEPNQKIDDMKLKERNVLTVFLNMNDQLMCGDDYVEVDEIRAKAKEFVKNEANDDHMPEKHLVNVPFFGDMMVTEKHVISLRCDRGSSYKEYLAVQNELVAAYNELRDEAAQAKWGKNYVDLSEDQQDAIRKIYPQNISEAEPKKYGEKK
ncbi:MAG: biopolymer transporter ExbD [Bacteroides sp.]|nr:biopolymer transporter ExbD [Bacteroides sp.]